MFNLIGRYVNNLNKDQVNNFLLSKSINLNNNELDFTYNFIKKNWNTFLSNPTLNSIDKYKDNYTQDNFIKIKNLANEYLKKYSNYL
ncbi:MAG: hypothetical protein IJ574_00630 [Bacilli bacterium]|nr:hypothetical protein [Bacilli bacterium]